MERNELAYTTVATMQERNQEPRTDPWSTPALRDLSASRLFSSYNLAHLLWGKALSSLAGPSDVQYWQSKRTVCYLLLRSRGERPTRWGW